MDSLKPAWREINDLFAKFGLAPPPTRLRDELVSHLASHRKALDAARSEAQAPQVKEGVERPEPAMEGRGSLPALSANAVRSGEWLRSENLLYTLAQEGWRKGEPVMVNRFMVQVSWDTRHATDAEAEALIGRLHDALDAQEVGQ